MPADTDRSRIAQLLGLGHTASWSAIHEEIRKRIEHEEGRTDVRETVRARTAELAARKGIPFLAALDEVREHDPKLIERLAEVYRRSR